MQFNSSNWLFHFICGHFHCPNHLLLYNKTNTVTPFIYRIKTYHFICWYEDCVLHWRGLVASKLSNLLIRFISEYQNIFILYLLLFCYYFVTISLTISFTFKISEHCPWKEYLRIIMKRISDAELGQSIINFLCGYFLFYTSPMSLYVIQPIKHM